MYRFAIVSAFLALISIGAPQLAHADDDKSFQTGHFAIPTPSTRATLSIDQRELTVERGQVELRLWIHNPTRQDVQTEMRMPLVDGPEGEPSQLREAYEEHFGELEISHDDRPQKIRLSSTRRAGDHAIDVVWNTTFPAHRTVQVTIDYPFLYERHEVDQRESWSFEIPGAASNAWAGRVHYSRFKFCDSTVVRRIADFGGDTRAWNARYPEYFRDYTFTIRPGAYRLDRYGKCMLWETENRHVSGVQGGFEVTMTKRWEKLMPMIPPGVDDEQAFLVRLWCAGGSKRAAPMWNREHLAAAIELTEAPFDEEKLQSAVKIALQRAHGGANRDQLDTYWSELPTHIRHMARIRLLEYAQAYLGKHTDDPIKSDFSRACTGNVESSVAPRATAVENRKRVDALLSAERAAYESTWRAIEEKY